MNSYSFNKAPIDKVIEISQRMYNQAMKGLERRNHIAKKHDDEEENQEQCTFRPNTRKRKFVKYPNPPFIKKQNDTILEERNWIQEQKLKDKKKEKQTEKTKALPPKRLSLYYRWEQKRKQKMLSNFVEQQIRRSVEVQRQTSPQRNSESTNDYYSRPVNRSLSPPHPANGVEEFIARQTTARLQKQEKEFLFKNPCSHTWNFTIPVESKIDSLMTNYMSLGVENYQKRQPPRYY